NMPHKGVYSSMESSNGELGFYVDNRTNHDKPWRVKVRSPSFHNIQVLPEIIQDNLLDDALIAFSSLSICPGELDR
ncbi:MAG: hypothetical protein KC493_11855, partial [Bacteriovoracaceae bacterium]|nr:hypothetical protein [Bacteriovoracaceae bacterium]